MALAVIAGLLPVAALAQPQPSAPLQPMPFPPELDGTLATGFVVPFGLPKVSFSADIRSEIAGTVFQQRQVFIPYRERLETHSADFTAVTVLYTDLLVGYTFVLGGKYQRYTEVDLRTTMLQPNAANNAYSAKWMVARDGEDVEDGLVRTRYRVQSVRPNGDSFVATVWVAEAYNIIVQSEGVSTVRGVARPARFKWSNIQIGPQDPALFYPPPGYARFGTGLSPTGTPRTDWGVQP